MAQPAVALKLEALVQPDVAAWTQALALTCELTVDMPLPGFRVADMLQLQRHAVIHSHWRLGTDVPLRVNGRLIAHGEFEVVGNHLAIRLTELA